MRAFQETGDQSRTIVIGGGVRCVLPFGWEGEAWWHAANWDCGFCHEISYLEGEGDLLCLGGYGGIGAVLYQYCFWSRVAYYLRVLCMGVVGDDVYVLVECERDYARRLWECWGVYVSDGPWDLV